MSGAERSLVVRVIAKVMWGRGGAKLVTRHGQNWPCASPDAGISWWTLFPDGPVAYGKTQDSAGTPAARVCPALPRHPPQRMATSGGHDRSGTRASASGAPQCPLYARSRARFGSFRVPGRRLERVQSAPGPCGGKPEVGAGVFRSVSSVRPDDQLCGGELPSLPGESHPGEHAPGAALVRRDRGVPAGHGAASPGVMGGWWWTKPMRWSSPRSPR
jgi:hypothetical protein